jgi:hypothetical protein
VNLLSLSLRNPRRLILAWLCCMGASARESRVSVAIHSFDVCGPSGFALISLTSSFLCWLSFPRPTKEWPYELLGPWAFREAFYFFGGPRGYLSPTAFGHGHTLRHGVDHFAAQLSLSPFFDFLSWPSAEPMGREHAMPVIYPSERENLLPRSSGRGRIGQNPNKLVGRNKFATDAS